MMRHQALHMCHVGKMTEIQLYDIGIFLLLLSAGNSQQAKNRAGKIVRNLERDISKRMEY